MPVSGEAAPDLDAAAIARLDAFLRGQVAGLSGGIAIARTTGGMSNPTYFVDYANRRMVLRKQPDAVLMPSAHAIDREYRVLRALHGSAVPVPAPILYCDARDVVGTPFYMMERLEGRVYESYAAPGVSPAHRAAMYGDMCRTMAAIHRLDVGALGLADFGKPGDYFARQLARWSAMWAGFRKGDDDIPALDRLIEWLRAALPRSDSLALCHGDLRIANLMFHPREPRVVGVLDWELSTLGHPLVDLAYNTQAWRMAPSENGGLLGLPLDELGIPEEDAYIERYYAEVGPGERMTDFHRAFAMFRAAVGSASVAARGLAGNAVLPDAARRGRTLALAYAGRAMAVVEGR